MPRLVLLLLAIVLPCLPLGSAAAARADDRPPNIVLLIGDDLGWPYAGFMGDPVVRTPNLDALAASGTTFVNAQATASICVPSQRTLLAGIHPEQWERRRAALQSTLGTLPIRSEVEHLRTLPRELVRRGYLAWEGGKLWDGTFQTAGFTHGLAVSLFHDWVRSDGEDFGRAGWSDGTVLAPLQAFLDQVGDRPFFAWIAPALPHAPYDAPLAFATPYDGLGLVPSLARYFTNVTWLDAFVGTVLAEIDARGLADDTLVLFVSDNGKEPDNDLAGAGRGKGTLYELGFRQPLIVRWPGHVSAGVRRDDLVSTLDVAPTILDYAGADALEDGSGVSLRAALESPAPVGRSRLVGRYPGLPAANDGSWVRTPSWRYLTAADGREELYRIDNDPLEQQNVAPLHPDLLPDFRADVAAWQAQLDAGRPRHDVAGQVRAADGTPLAGEAVELTGRSTAGERIRLSVLTSARGELLFDAVPAGTYAVKGRRSSTALTLRGWRRRIPVPLPANGLDVFLPMTGKHGAPPGVAGDAVLRGTVRDGAGRPLADATVKLRGTGSTRQVSVVLRTGEDGRYRAEWLPAGSYLVAATSQQRRRTASITVSLAAAEDHALDLALPPA